MKLQIQFVYLSFFAWIFFIAATSSLPPKDKELIIHEWGTFTTLFSSKGEQLDGLYIEEEKLPEFVYKNLLPETTEDRFIRQKGSFIEPLNVTVKMETPVLYFYSPKPKNVSIDVGFPAGTIAQWYPNRSGGDKLSKEQQIDFKNPYNGLISWNNIEVLAPDDETPYTPATSQTTPTWLAPRATNANKIRVKNEVEKFLFYRGIGNLKIPLSFQFNSNKEIIIKNNGDRNIPYIFVLEKNDDGTNIWWTGKLDKNSSTKATSTLSSIGYVNAKIDEFKKHLIKEGLYHEEAEAMLKTWENSYFKTNGFRVFYILPAEAVPELLPMDIVPEPAELKRVFVGRCDIFMPAFEAQLKKEFEQNPALEQYQSHRYFLGMKSLFK